MKSPAYPDEVGSIEADAFKDCSELTLRVYRESYAEEYAKENGIKYETYE